MSFLITSNTGDKLDSQLNEGINKPFSYFNNLQDTFKIPKNSEIAVQSVKINKEGNFASTSRNSQFYIYQGTKLSDVTNNNIDLTTSVPSYGFVTNDFGQNTFSANIDDYAGFLQKAFRRATYLPNNQVGVVNTLGTKVEVERNASGVDFEGFKFTFNGHKSASNVNNRPTTWIPALVGQLGQAYTGGALNISNDGNDEIDLIGTNFPLSLTNGCMDVSVTGAAGSAFSVGLTRCTRTQRIASDGTFPNVNNPAVVSEDLEKPLYYTGFDPYYDYQVVNEEQSNGSYLIKLFHSVNGGAPYYEFNREEVDYRTKLGIANYIDSNASNITNVGFIINNERVTAQVYDNTAAAWVVLANGLDANASRNLKPVNQCCWNLYPKVSLEGGESMQMLQFNGLDIPNHVYGSETFNTTTGRYVQSHSDWWATQVNIYDQYLCDEIDGRFMMVGSSVTPYTQKGLNASGFVDKDFVLVLTKSDQYVPSRGANTQDIFGFTNRGIVDQPSNSLLDPIIFISDDAPKVTSNNSLFVRLKNMTFNSVNFSKSSLSKILYHLPRFDNSGSEIGGLFFEPAERVYLKLNNTEDLFINDFQVDICNSDETLANNLTGKTIVCFHIRDAKI